MFILLVFITAFYVDFHCTVSLLWKPSNKLYCNYDGDKKKILCRLILKNKTLVLSLILQWGIPAWTGEKSEVRLVLLYLLTCMADDQVSLSHVLCYRVFEPKSLQSEERTAVSSWKTSSSSDLKDQALIPAGLEHLMMRTSLSVRTAFSPTSPVWTHLQGLSGCDAIDELVEARGPDGNKHRLHGRSLKLLAF